MFRIISLLFISSLLCTSVQSQDNILFNILVLESGNNWEIAYEKLLLDKRHRAVKIDRTSERDSFILWILNDRDQLHDSRREMLFYIHGMWGSQPANFRRAYALMHHQYIDSEASDIARIVSLKWPGNDFEYTRNKERLYEISQLIAGELSAFFTRLQFLNWLVNREIPEIDILAHSLGNELLKEIFRHWMEDESEIPILSNIVYAAPDLDFDIFENTEITFALSKAASNHYFYFSERDLTLEISRSLNKLDRLGRLGPSSTSELPDNFFFIDVTLVKDDNNLPDLLTGHSYYRSSPKVASDMLHAMMNKNPANQNRLPKKQIVNSYVLDPQEQP